ncbi:MAG: gluconate 2-dehydrogenase subunit 3 family protein [Pseudohongiella sp.]|nr:gluconate 2-dehydrogenase subunit 3 family protein [Pseudohongiella sp.]MDO9521302.1 gluconate 2-dehydrogenase subunit 3 family protein [Pseudohongiella sp.]
MNDRDTTERELSRRQFLAGLSTAAKGSLIVLSLPAILTACRQSEEQAVEQADNPDSSIRYKLLSDELATELDAISARIVPTDETPGAREAGSVRFMDVVLADGRLDQLETLQTGVTALNDRANSQFGVSLFSELSETQQDELLTAIETSPFFSTVRFLTVASLFAFPQYGGTGPDVGYNLIGMTHAHAYMPPFGYYDADYAARGE